MSHQDHFKIWFADVLEGLYANEHAGFAILMVTLPLLERYLRQKNGVYEKSSLGQKFYTGLRGVFPALLDNKTAERFWGVYRHGLLHQGTLSQGWTPGGDVSMRSSQAIEIDPASGRFLVNPALLAKTVIKIIDDDFGTFEGPGSRRHKLPVPGATPDGPTGAR